VRYDDVTYDDVLAKAPGGYDASAIRPLRGQQPAGFSRPSRWTSRAGARGFSAGEGTVNNAVQG